MEKNKPEQVNVDDGEKTKKRGKKDKKSKTAVAAEEIITVGSKKRSRGELADEGRPFKRQKRMRTPSPSVSDYNAEHSASLPTPRATPKVKVTFEAVSLPKVKARTKTAVAVPKVKAAVKAKSKATPKTKVARKALVKSLLAEEAKKKRSQARKRSRP